MRRPAARSAAVAGSVVDMATKLKIQVRLRNNMCSKRLWGRRPGAHWPSMRPENPPDHRHLRSRVRPNPALATPAVRIHIRVRIAAPEHTRAASEVECGVRYVMAASPDRAAGRVAASQRTMITHEQLVACGLGPRAIKWRLETGRLHVEFRGVYSFGCGELPPLAREQAAPAGVRRGGVPERPLCRVLLGHAQVRTARRSRSGRGAVPRSSRRDHVHRIKADRPARAVPLPRRALGQLAGRRRVLEVAAVAPQELLDVIDEGLARRVLNRRHLQRVLARHRRCRGPPRLAALARGRGSR